MVNCNKLFRYQTNEIQTCKMTVKQEFLNAFTELLWSLYVIILGYIFLKKSKNIKTCLRLLIIMISTGLHLPFSFTYHLRQALRLGDDPMDNKWRRLDQAGINIGCITYCFGTSGSILYGLFALLVHFYNVIEIWLPTTNPTKRQINIFIGIIMYLFPILWFNYFIKFIFVLFFLTIGIIGFIFNDIYFFGYGSSIMHLSMIPYHWAILSFILMQSENI